MPRRSGQQAASLAVAGRAKAKAAQPKPKPLQERAEDEVEVQKCHCCTEKLDDTDLSGLPCPCGYKICLFCVERVKQLNSGICPHCRTPYGSEGQCIPTRCPSESSDTPSYETLTVPTHQVAQRVQASSRAGHGASHEQTTTYQNGYHPRQRLQPDESQSSSSKHSRTPSSDAQLNGLPSGATWGAQVLRQQSAESAQQVDDSAWPTLPTSQATASKPTFPTDYQSHALHSHQLSPQPSLQSLPSLPTGLVARQPNNDTRLPVLLQQDLYDHQAYPALQPPPPPPPPRTPPPAPPPPAQQHHARFATAEVSSRVSGVARQHSLHLSLDNRTVAAHPGLVSKQQEVRQAVAEGRITSAQGAALLVRYLNQLDLINGKIPGAASQGRAPPGFANATYGTAQQVASPFGAGHPAVATPQPPTPRTPVGQRSPTAADSSGIRRSPSSLWSDSNGLPGIDLSASLPLQPQVPQSVQALWAASPATTAAGLERANATPATAASKPAPPGFAAGKDAAATAPRNGYRPHAYTAAASAQAFGYANGQDEHLPNGSSVHVGASIAAYRPIGY